MHRPDGATNVDSGVYREIVPAKRLVFTWIWEAAGAAFNAGQKRLVTVIFAARDGKTEMTLRHKRLVNPEAHDSHRHGWMITFDKLTELLGSSPAQ